MPALVALPHAEAAALRSTPVPEVAPAVPFLAHAGGWKRTLKLKPRQLDQYESDLKLFGADLALAQVDRETAQKWALDRGKAGDSNKTISRRLAALRGYWRWMADEKLASDAGPNGSGPFDRLRLPKEAKDRGVRRTSFTAPQVAALYDAASGHTAQWARDEPLAALIALAAHTGARIEELCGLTVAQVDLVGWVMHVSSKTRAGDRVVPIHNAIRPMVARLVRNAMDHKWLIHCRIDNSYGERSQAIGKRFGRLKSRLGHGPELVFHSLRKTVATMLQDSGCPEAIAADILGHELQTMSYGVYSTGSAIETRRTWLERAIAYPRMELKGLTK
jgi:integrase